MTELLKEYEDYIDNIAIEFMKVMIMRKAPQGVPDSKAIARSAYKHALTMLEVKLELEDILHKEPILNSYKKRPIK